MKAFRKARFVFGDRRNENSIIKDLSQRLTYENLGTYWFTHLLKMDEPPPKDRVCRLCERIGHFVENCPMKRSNKAKLLKDDENDEFVEKNQYVRQKPTNPNNNLRAIGRGYVQYRQQENQSSQINPHQYGGRHLKNEIPPIAPQLFYGRQNEIPPIGAQYAGAGRRLENEIPPVEPQYGAYRPKNVRQNSEQSHKPKSPAKPQQQQQQQEKGNETGKPKVILSRKSATSV